MAATSSAIKAGGAYVELFADGTALASGLKAAEAQIKRFGKSVGIVGAAISGIGAAISGPLFGAAKKFADAGSALNDMSARTGASVETLSALGYAANQTGTDMETVEGAIRKMQKALQQGSEENIQAEASFAALGLSAKRLEQLNPEQAFGVIAKQIEKIENPTAKAAVAMQIFGKSGTALIPMIDDLDALTNEAKQFGLVWTGEEAKKADALGDAFDLLKAVFGRVITAIGSELAPLLTEVAGELARAAKYAIDFAKANGPLIVTAFKVAVGISAAGAAITALGVVIFGVGATFGVLAAAVTFLLNPITLVVAALAGLTTWFLTSTKAGGEALSWLGDRFAELKADAEFAFGGIAAALKAGNIKLAAQILWAALKVEWLKGTNYLRESTRDGLDYVMGLYDKFRFGVASLITDLMTGVQAAFINGWHAVAGIVDSAGAGIYKSFLVLTDQILSSWEDAWAAIGLPVEGAGSAKAERQKGLVAADQGAANTANDREATRQKELAGVGQQNIDAQQALKDQQAAGLEARRKAAQDAAAAGVADLKAAQDNLAGLVEKAKEGAGAAAGIVDKKKGGPEGEGGLSPKGLDKAIDKTKAKISVAGSFAATSAQGLGAGDTVAVAEKQLDEQKKTNDHLKSLNKKADKKKAAFV